MPVSFVRLRIAGFKSFAEPAVVEILPGLTGVVGPNGCGKSNVVEALRWAMGENSARALRGGEMDDVIFAGTANRPGRNLAEVTISLEDAAGLAPPPFHELPELQVSRRIERGSGSTYRVNNRDARARDVQTLFADLASGARSSAMVSQGRVASIVDARPEERRSVLEEAAGITGLHARRHEAELKLRQAEANLERAEDLRGQLEVQLDGLRRQARQAARFRAMNGMIADAERELFAIARARTERDRAAAAAAFRTAEASADASATAAGQGSAVAAGAEAALPGLREAERESRARLERARLLHEAAAGEVERARQTLDAAAGRRAQISRDLGHAGQSLGDSADAVRRLDAEAAVIAVAADGHAARLVALEAAAKAAKTTLADAEGRAQALTEQGAALGARRDAAMRRVAEAHARAKRATDAAARADADHADALRRAVDPARLRQADDALAAAIATQVAAMAALDQAEQARSAARLAATQARIASQSADAEHGKLQAEAAGLAAALTVHAGRGTWPPVLDRMKVPPGLETAIAAALGDTLEAATDPNAGRHWRALDPPAPAGSLLSLVEAPAELHRALAAVSLVADAAAGDRAQPGLAPGHGIVTREGGFWRWDGYTVRPGAPSATVVRMQQRNRLDAVRGRLAEADATRLVARDAKSAAECTEADAATAEQHARTARRDADPRLDRARIEATTLRSRSDDAASRIAAATHARSRTRPELDAAHAALADAEAETATLPGPAAARTALDGARAALATARAAEAGCARSVETTIREHGAGTARARVIVAETDDWQMRARDAADRVTDLRARAGEAEREHDALSGEPDRVRRAQADATGSLDTAEAAHRRDAATLSAGQSRAEEAIRAQRAADTARATARESLVRAEANLIAADHAWGAVAERMLERLGADPALPPPPPDLSADAEDRARRKHDRLQREREGMGPVNMRAEMEADAIGGQVDQIVRERDEIGSAIAKLRGSIGHLNREGRERLTTVFTEIDRHFQALFGRMFGGGRAHLGMVGSDDPLQAGLEIYAQPPGKKLATLSLLSGGEQALTALSLIFAVFRCNPAPICVLDEVDAPLDDANVERLCALLDDMVRETGTRFLVVTHHAHTMARMDRLFGVTMQERGVSRVLSVDLTRATAMVERAAAE